jgi:hypothetical protein
MQSTRRILVSSLLFVSLLAPNAAFAQPKPVAPTGKGAGVKPGKPEDVKPEPPKTPTLAESLSGPAKAEYDSAALLYKAGDFAGARIKFQNAYDQAKDPRLLWNMAACERNLRHYAKVFVLVQKYLAEGEKVISADERLAATNLLATVEPLTVKLRVVVNQPDADVAIDGESVGKTPIELPIIVDLGVRKVKVTKFDFKELEKDVPIGGAAEAKVEFSLVQIPHTARVTINTQAFASVVIDGKASGKGTVSSDLSGGPHNVRVSAEGYLPYTSDVDVVPGESRTIQVTLEKESKVPIWPFIAGGAVLLAGGVAAGLLYNPGRESPPAGTFNPGTVVVQRGGLRF